MLENISVIYQNAIRIERDKIIYFDPYKMDRDYNDADIIFITHDHYDHYSEEDINKIRKDSTVIVLPKSMHDKAVELGFNEDNIIDVIPNNNYEVNYLKFKTVPSYNIDKPYHPVEDNWVGYIITLDGVKYYVAGDTDVTPEIKEINYDIAFIPIGGKFTMDYVEAAKYINEMKPKAVVPTHYGCIVGNKQDGVIFKDLLDDDIECYLLMKFD